MPTIEELTLGGALNWQHADCWRLERNAIAEWRANQDWSAMKKLDLPLDYGDYMPSGLTGSMPCLQFSALLAEPED